jgi:UDP-N-acetylglucosamine--N-acetylmuramyl-(pentapeptide) pyrophosphoryl-undecaprenol N-acetylglucosamine transferase
MPSIAISDYFKQNFSDISISFFVARKNLDKQILEKTDYQYYQIFSGKLRRYFDLENFIDFFKVFVGFFQSLYLLFKLKPDLIFSKGGYVSVPVYFASLVLRIPLVAHESDTVAGLANRIVFKGAKAVFMSFPIKGLKILGEKKGKFYYTGTPLRKEVLQIKQAEQKINFTKKLPLILAMGASQGSVQINELTRYLAKVYQNQYNFLLVTGYGKKESLDLDNLKEVELLSSQDLPYYLKKSDLVISRAGANSLFELAYLKKASIIIPHPFTGGDHQRKNAKIFADRGAVICFDPDNKNLKKELKNKLQEFLDNSELKEKLEKNIEKLAPKNSVEIIAKLILKILK